MSLKKLFQLLVCTQRKKFSRIPPVEKQSSLSCSPSVDMKQDL